MDADPLGETAGPPRAGARFHTRNPSSVAAVLSMLWAVSAALPVISKPPSTGVVVFAITLPTGIARQAHTTAEQPPSDSLNGRVYVIVSRDGGQEPRLQGPPGMTADAAPFWGVDVDDFEAGHRVELREGDPQVMGFPLSSLEELPKGHYFVQAFMNVYETFHRSDGSVVKLHMPCGDGHRIMWGTGNLYSDVKSLELTHAGERIELELTHVIPPPTPTPPGGTCQQVNIGESEHSRLLKIRSERLSAFWGRPMYVAARIILPRDYSRQQKQRYPVIFAMNHHPRAYQERMIGWTEETTEDGGNAGFRFQENGANPFSRWWLGPEGPPVIIVQPLSENPYYDTSYWVDSANAGPYGQVLTQELLPEVNRRFRTIDAPWARTLTGCSSGGWMAAAPQVFYPDLFGGAFIFAPDIVDFRSLWLIDLYKDANAYWNETDWRRWPRPYFRDDVGNTIVTTGDWAHLELALGNASRSGEYFAQLDATWGPQGPDGYPVSRWNPATGQIDRAAVAQYRKYDLSAYLEGHWASLEPKLRGGRLQFFVTETDNYYTNLAVHLLQKRVAKLSPASDARFNYFPKGSHCRAPIMQQELITEMVKFMSKAAGGPKQAEDLRR